MGEQRLKAALAEVAEAVNTRLDAMLACPEGDHARVYQAMHYATLAGGKRLRPFLIVQSADLFDVPRDASLTVATAIELVHTYSLVHDDLPCMDDDDLRRGMPTVHVKFDEATAVLAGDGLLTMAFEVLASERAHPDPSVRVALISSLAARAGGAGMVGGQMIDLLAEEKLLDYDHIVDLQQMKTGALFGHCCEAGAILGGADDVQRRALLDYAAGLGLAFQIADDLLDVEGDAAVVGKAVGKDAGAGKATFVTLLGVEGARNKARDLVSQAKSRLAPFAERAIILRELANFVINRQA